MSLKKTLLFAVLAGCLGAYIYFVETPTIQQEARGDRLLEFDPAEVEAIDLAYPDQPDISAAKGPDGWKLSSPLEAEADIEQIDRLIKAVADVEPQRRILMSDAEPLATYGLEGDGSQARLQLRLSGGGELKAIIVGDSTPVGFSAFVRLEDSDEIVVTPLIFHTGVKKSVFDLREKRMFRFETKNATGLALQVGEKSTRLQRQGDDWMIVEPVNRKANETEVSSLLNGITQIRALDYFDDEALEGIATGLAESVLKVEVELGGRSPMAFRLGDQIHDGPRGYYLERTADGQVAKVAEWIKDRFDKDLGDLLENKLFDCNGKDPVRVNFERNDGGSYSLSKDDTGQWTMEPPEEGQGVRQPLAVRSIRSLVGLSGKRVIIDSDKPASEYGLDEPTVVVELTAHDGASCGRARGSEVDDGGDDTSYYFMREVDGSIMEATQFTFSTMDTRREDFLTPR